MPMRWQAERQAVADAARRMAELGLVSGTAGNVSVRLEDDDDTGRGLMAVTPSGVGYDGMAADDVVATDFDLETVAGELAPSSESLLHVGIYEAAGGRGGGGSYPLGILQRVRRRGRGPAAGD